MLSMHTDFSWSLDRNYARYLIAGRGTRQLSIHSGEKVKSFVFWVVFFFFGEVEG